MMNRKEYMTETLPEPESRKESYLAKAAGMTVEELPTPASREELYLNAIAQGGGGGSDITVVQTTGQSTTDVMSQKAVTDIIGDVETALHIINNGSGE